MGLGHQAQVDADGATKEQQLEAEVAMIFGAFLHFLIRFL